MVPPDELRGGLDAFQHRLFILTYIFLRQAVHDGGRGHARELVEHEPLEVLRAVLSLGTNQTTRRSEFAYPLLVFSERSFKLPTHRFAVVRPRKQLHLPPRTTKLEGVADNEAV